MSTVRVAPSDVGRLVPVSLTDVPRDGLFNGRHYGRLLASRAMREKRWNDELRPDVGYSPTVEQRCDALIEAVLVERAALYPSGREYLLPEEAVREVLGGA